MGILGLSNFSKPTPVKVKKNADATKVWIQVADLHNTVVALDTKAKKIQQIIVSDRELCNAMHTLKIAKEKIHLHGATEGLMSVLNLNNELSDAINLPIPEITSINARAVGISCEEAIDEKQEEAKDLVSKFMCDLCCAICDYLTKLTETSVCQHETLNTLMEDIFADITLINEEEFEKEVLFGYAQPVFKDRLSALQNIYAGLKECGDNFKESVLPSLKILGYNVEEEVYVAKETPEQAAAEAPDASTILAAPESEAQENEEDYHEGDAAPASTEGLEEDGAPKEDAPKEDAPKEEEPKKEESAAAPTEETTEVAPAENVPADVAQEQPLVVFRWTPSTIRDAANDLLAFLGSVGELSSLSTTLDTFKSSICSKVAEGAAADANQKAVIEAEVNTLRQKATFIGDVLHIFGSALSELVDQIVSMIGKVKKTEAASEGEGNAVPVDEVEQEPAISDRCSGPKKDKKKLEMKDNASLGKPDEITNNPADPTKQDSPPAGELENDPSVPKKVPDAPPAVTLPNDPKTEGPSQTLPVKDEINEEVPIIPPTEVTALPPVDPAAVPPVVPPAVEPTVEPVVPPVTPETVPGQVPIVEQPIIPPTATDEADIQNPEVPTAKPPEVPGNIDPNADPEPATTLTEPILQPVETPDPEKTTPEDLGADKTPVVNSTPRRRWF